MFKIQNICGGSLSLKLEHSCVILQNANYYDLDGVCSRQWIHTDPDLQSLIKHKHIRIVHDSESHVSKAPLTSGNTKAFNVLKPKEPVVATLPDNTYLQTTPSQKIDLPTPTVYPNPKNRMDVTNRNAVSKVTKVYPQVKQEDPIIVDLSKITSDDQPIIEALPVIKVNDADLKELFKEFPDLKPRKRGRRKKKEAEKETSPDGQN